MENTGLTQEAREKIIADATDRLMDNLSAQTQFPYILVAELVCMNINKKLGLVGE